MEEYRRWAAEAGPWLRDRWTMSGFWVNTGADAVIFGADPHPSPHGPANVTWIIQWNDRTERDAAWDALWHDDDWNDLWARHPGFDGCRQLSVRFLEPA